jgi:hypothetical protein
MIINNEEILEKLYELSTGQQELLLLLHAVDRRLRSG